MPSDVSLTLIVFVPLIGAMVIALLPVRTELERFRVRTGALLATGLPLAIAIFDLLGEVGNPAQGAIAQPSIDAPWLRGFYFQLDYHLGVDGLSLMLLFAVTAVFPALVLASWRMRERTRSHFALLLIAETSLAGFFATQDLLLLVVFFWLPVFPLALLVGSGSRPGAREAGRRLLVTQSLGAAALLVAALLMLLQTGNTTFNFVTLSTVGPLKGASGLIAAGLLLFAFGARMAIFPLQRWLLDGVAAAPTPVAMLLVVSSLPVGAYGLVRVLLGMDPRGGLQLVVPVLLLAVLTLYWSALRAVGERDVRRATAALLAGVSGPVLLGIISFSETSLSGALWLAFALTFVAPLLVLAIGAVADRGGGAEITSIAGRAAGADRLKLMFAVGAASLGGVPFLVGFPGVFQVVVGSFAEHRFITAVVILGMGLLAYAAWRVGTGPFWAPGGEPELPEPITDSRGSEFYAGWWLAAAAVVFGITAGYFVPYTVHGTDLVAARVSSMAPAKVPGK